MNLKRRLTKLERHLTDSCGLVPHTPAWMEYWTRECEKVRTKDDYQPVNRIPLEVVRAYLQSGASE